MSFRLKGPVLFLVICLPLLCATNLMAQAVTAEIIGTVTDASGGLLPNAQVTITNLGTNVSRSMTTTAVGTYAFSLLPVGSYSISIELSGFKTFTVPSLTLAVGDRARVDAKMEIGALTETVEVSASTAGLLQTDSATVGSLVTAESVQDLPVNGRNFIKLVQLQPGVNEGTGLGSGDRPDDRRQTSSFSANGVASEMNNYLLDGLDNNERSIATIIVKPSIDAMQEVKVQTNLYGADVGRAGGAVVNMVTKSGTNDFHGTLFEFVRNDMFDAKDFFNVPQVGNPAAGVKPKYRQNQFGGSLGGPIIKDKTFFFVDYEALRIIQGATHQLKIPTACQLGREECNGVTQMGNFSDILDFNGTVLNNPVTNTPLEGNIMPPSLINTAGGNYASMYPTLTSAACPDPTNCMWISNVGKTQNAHTGDLRFDHNFSEKDTFFARYSINQTDSVFPGWLPDATVASVSGISVVGSGFGGNFNSDCYQRQQSFAAGFTHIFRPNLLLQLNFQLARFVTDSEALNRDKPTLQDQIGGPANVNSSYRGTEGLAFIWFVADNYAGLGDQFALPTAYWDTNYQYTGNMVWSRGNHNLKFGAGLLRRDWSQFQALFKAGIMINNNRSGNAMVNLMASTYMLAIRDLSLVAPQYRSTEYGLYLQDDWRANNWLTVNLGVRYDIFTPLKEKHNQLSNFDITDATVRAGGKMWIAGEEGISDTVNINTQYGDIQPRLGLAATIAKGTVIRGGFGMSYHPTNVASPAQMKNAPFSTAATILNIPMLVPFPLPFPPSTFNDPFPPVEPGATCLSASCGAPEGSSFTIAQATAQDYKYSRIYMYNFMVEKEFAGNVFSIGYVGVAGRNLGRIYTNANMPLPVNGPGGCGIYPAIPACQPYNSELPFVSRVQLLKTDGTSNYHGLQLALQRRYRAGLTLSSNYTWGKSLADTGGAGGTCETCGIVLNDSHYDYGESDYSVRHRFVVTANYELPFGKSFKGLQQQFFGGWAVNGIYLYSTGLPFNVMNTEDLQGTDSYQGTATGNRPDKLAQPENFNKTISQWFDITAFRRQALGTAGNMERNSFHNPNMTRVDFSVFKDFLITETVKLQFRAEFFNIFNTPTFGSPNATISSWTNSDKTDRTATPTSAGNFGSITSTNGQYTPRDIQFALKLIF
jgi:hypothetical protein